MGSACIETARAHCMPVGLCAPSDGVSRLRRETALRAVGLLPPPSTDSLSAPARWPGPRADGPATSTSTHARTGQLRRRRRHDDDDDGAAPHPVRTFSPAPARPPPAPSPPTSDGSDCGDSEDNWAVVERARTALGAEPAMLDAVLEREPAPFAAPLNPTMHTDATIAACIRMVEDDEVRRLCMVAYM
jgi:hypothetical protein